MEFDHDIDLSKRKASSQLIVKRALERGWTVTAFESNLAIFLMTPPGTTKKIKIFSAAPSQTSYPAAKIAKDKFITNQILALESIPVPKEMLLNLNKFDTKLVTEFVNGSKKIVLKPLDASHGQGVRVGISSYEELQKILKEESGNSRTKYILQEHLDGYDIRVLCIGYKYADAITRTPAYVIGDGIHTVRELIDIENTQSYRGENYKARLNVIPIEIVQQHLDEAALNEVPDKELQIQVVGISNVGVGGTRTNLREDIPLFLRQIAEQTAKALELSVCGVDFIVNKIPASDDSPADLNARVIEANDCPMITMYEDLTSSDQKRVTDLYLDFIASY